MKACKACLQLCNVFLVTTCCIHTLFRLIESAECGPALQSGRVMAMHCSSAQLWTYAKSAKLATAAAVQSSHPDHLVLAVGLPHCMCACKYARVPVLNAFWLTACFMSACHDSMFGASYQLGVWRSSARAFTNCVSCCLHCLCICCTS
jgi:hypothetical protein